MRPADPFAAQLRSEGGSYETSRFTGVFGGSFERRKLRRRTSATRSTQQLSRVLGAAAHERLRAHAVQQRRHRLRSAGDGNRRAHRAESRRADEGAGGQRAVDGRSVAGSKEGAQGSHDGADRTLGAPRAHGHGRAVRADLWRRAIAVQSAHLRDRAGRIADSGAAARARRRRSGSSDSTTARASASTCRA